MIKQLPPDVAMYKEMIGKKVLVGTSGAKAPDGKVYKGVYGKLISVSDPNYSPTQDGSYTYAIRVGNVGLQNSIIHTVSECDKPCWPESSNFKIYQS